MCKSCCLPCLLVGCGSGLPFPRCCPLRV
jgi:hypothetical protein